MSRVNNEDIYKDEATEGLLRLKVFKKQVKKKSFVIFL